MPAVNIEASRFTSVHVGKKTCELLLLRVPHDSPGGFVATIRACTPDYTSLFMRPLLIISTQRITKTRSEETLTK
jgi:hypothetical protein